MSFSAVILAGGKSSRMGRDKAFLELGGQTLLERQIALAEEAGAGEVFISGREGADYSRFSCPVIKDKVQDAGPLAGIESALGMISSPLLLVLAVDLPEMNAMFLRSLFSQCQNGMGAIPCVCGQVEPLAAFYPRTAKMFAESLLRDENNSVTFLARHCVQSKLARFVECGDHERKFFANWNSPAEISAFNEIKK